MTNSMEKKPAVFEYLDARTFLRDYYSYRKNSDVKFSYETWADELKYSSRSYLRMVLIGRKNISDGFLSAIITSLQLSTEEAQYWEILVKFSQSETQTEKQAFNQKLFQILRRHTGQSEVADYAEFVESPLYPRLLTLLTFQDIKPVRETYARLLNVSLEKIDEGLKRLEKVGLAESSKVDDEIHWKSLKRRFKVPDNAGSQIMIRFHEQSLADAAKALETKKETRRFRSLLLPLSEDELNQVYTLLDSFANEQIARFNSDNFQDRRLFQLNLNIHAVTELEVDPSSVP